MYDFTSNVEKGETGDKQNTEEEGVFLSDKALAYAKRKTLSLNPIYSIPPSSIGTYLITLHESKSTLKDGESSTKPVKNYQSNTIVKKNKSSKKKHSTKNEDKIFEDYEKQHEPIRVKENLLIEKEEGKLFGNLIFGLIISFIGIAILFVLFRTRKKKELLLPLTYEKTK